MRGQGAHQDEMECFLLANIIFLFGHLLLHCLYANLAAALSEEAKEGTCKTPDFLHPHTDSQSSLPLTLHPSSYLVHQFSKSFCHCALFTSLHLSEENTFSLEIYALWLTRYIRIPVFRNWSSNVETEPEFWFSRLSRRSQFQPFPVSHVSALALWQNLFSRSRSDRPILSLLLRKKVSHSVLQGLLCGKSIGFELTFKSCNYVCICSSG